MKHLDRILAGILGLFLIALCGVFLLMALSLMSMAYQAGILPIVIVGLLVGVVIVYYLGVFMEGSTRD